jgi:2TM domain-containing protein
MTAIEPSTELREQALERLKKRQDFRAHLLVYVLFNLGVWGLWLLTGTGFPWPAFITFFWGIGLIMNAWEVFWRRPITEADVQREVEHLSR